MLSGWQEQNKNMYVATDATGTDIGMAPMHCKALPQADPGVGNRAQPGSIGHAQLYAALVSLKACWAPRFMLLTPAVARSLQFPCRKLAKPAVAWATRYS
jgi:hypothetical protein